MRSSTTWIGASSLVLTLIAGAQAAPLGSREFNKLKKDAARAVATRQYGSLGSILRELAEDDSKRALELMSQLVVAAPESFDAAVSAAAGMRADEVRESLLKDVERSGTKPGEKIFLLEVAAQMDEATASQALTAGLDAYKRQPEVARAAVQLIAKAKLVKAVDGLIDLLGELESRDDDEDSLLTHQVRDALASITGESFANAELYRGFWAPRKASFRPVTGGKPKNWEGTSERKRPTFFGSEIRSNRIVFVIDVSGSMHAADPPPRQRTGSPGRARGPQTGGGDGDEGPQESESRVRIDRAKFQLQQAVKALPDSARFTILAYSGAMMPPGNAQGGDPDGLLPPKIGGFEWLRIWAGKLTGASDRSKGSALEWIDELAANGSTFTYNALRAAFEVDGADTIVLLSDGAPTEIDRATGQPMSTDQILKKVEALNRFKRLRIMTFGFDTADPRGNIPGFGGGSSMDLSEFMRDLAEQNGGTYTPIR
ncbi:MAG: hypothetical protein R3F62_08165 [Planctomycetota bacterium]